MYRRAYILTFDRDDSLNYKAMHNKLTNLPIVFSWWHYIKSAYILICNTDNATALQREISKIMPNKRFLVIEVNLRNRNGILPPKAWDWIKNQTERID